MFKAANEGTEKIAQQKQKVIKQLESLFAGRVNIYIDYANVRPWSSRLGWHIDLKRLKRFLNSFDNINELKSKGLFIFDIKKIKDFVCWKRELGV